MNFINESLSQENFLRAVTSRGVMYSHTAYAMGDKDLTSFQYLVVIS